VSAPEQYLVLEFSFNLNHGCSGLGTRGNGTAFPHPFLALHPWRTLWNVLSCINADKILPENMVISDPISFNSFTFDVYMKLNGRMTCLYPVSVTKSKQGYGRFSGSQIFPFDAFGKVCWTCDALAIRI